MAQKTHKGRPLQFLLVEPNEPDSRWFDIVLDESHLPATTVHSSTCIRALEAWRECRLPAIDAVVVSERLPMLTIEEFVNAARTLDSDVPIVVLGDQLPLFQPLTSDYERFTKPLSEHDIERLWCIARQRFLRTRQRVALTPRVNWGSQVRMPGLAASRSSGTIPHSLSVDIHAEGGE